MSLTMIRRLFYISALCCGIASRTATGGTDIPLIPVPQTGQY